MITAGSLARSLQSSVADTTSKTRLLSYFGLMILFAYAPWLGAFMNSLNLSGGTPK
jgi:hypothetical protein